MTVRIEFLGLNRKSSGGLTRFSDSFNRTSGGVGVNWPYTQVAQGGGSAGFMRIGAGSDGPQAMIAAAQSGALTKRDSASWCAALDNSLVYGVSQFSRWNIISEAGASNFAGPAVQIDNAVPNPQAYGMIVTNTQWKLSRIINAVDTPLIALTPFAEPATLEIQSIITPGVNTLFVLLNGVQVGTFVDNSGIIGATGLPGFYAGTPNAADSSQWRNAVCGMMTHAGGTPG